MPQKNSAAVLLSGGIEKKTSLKYHRYEDLFCGD